MIVSFDFVFSYVVVVNSTKSIYIDRNLLWSMNDWLTILIVLIDHGCQFCRWRKKFLTNKQKKMKILKVKNSFFQVCFLIFFPITLIDWFESISLINFSFKLQYFPLPLLFFLNIITLNCFVSIFSHEDSVFIYGFFFFVFIHSWLHQIELDSLEFHYVNHHH